MITPRAKSLPIVPDLPGKAVHLILGPPGTGKTTRQRELLLEEIKNGVPPDKIALVTFGRNAIQDAKEKILEVVDFPESRLEWIRTIHSMAFHLLGLHPDQVMGPEHWRGFAERYVYDMTDIPHRRVDSAPASFPKNTHDDELRAVVERARSCLHSVEYAAERYPGNFIRKCVPQFAERLEKHKGDHQLLDFTDMLEEAIRTSLRPPVDVAFIDEAQDLSPLQILAIRHWFHTCERIYIAGDDDQAIYGFQGADPDWLMSLSKTCGEEEVLGQSHRVPPRIHAVAGKIISGNQHRVPKQYNPRQEGGEGEVAFLDLERALQAIKDEEDVFILARNRGFLCAWVKQLTQAGIPFKSFARGVSGPFDKPGVFEGLRAAAQLRTGDHIWYEDLFALLEYVRSKEALPHGTKKRLERLCEESLEGGLVSRRELSDDWQLGAFLADLDQAGPVAVLSRLTKAERQYLERVILRYGGRLPKRIPISLYTIHGAKGGEADVVVWLTGMSKASYREYTQGGARGREAENRLAYVAATRATRKLIVVPDRGPRRFHLSH